MKEEGSLITGCISCPLRISFNSVFYGYPVLGANTYHLWKMSMMSLLKSVTILTRTTTTNICSLTSRITLLKCNELLHLLIVIDHNVSNRLLNIIKIIKSIVIFKDILTFFVLLVQLHNLHQVLLF